MNSELILRKTGWTTEQIKYYGVVVFNLLDMHEKPIANIISTRDESYIQIDCVILKDNTNISLKYDTIEERIDFVKSDKEIKDSVGMLLFLDNIEKITSHTTPQFFPTKHINSKIKIKV